MAVAKLNYVPGDSEVITEQSAGIITFDEWQYFALDGFYKFMVADITVYADGVEVPNSNYSLSTDVKYTDIEDTRSGSTLYSQIKFTNASYDGQAMTVSGKNFGTYTDNEATLAFLANHYLGYENGFVDQDDVLVTPSIDSTGTVDRPKISVQSVSGAELVYFVDFVRLTLPAGEVKEQTFGDPVTGYPEGEAWISLDINGDIVDDTDRVITGNCALHLMRWNADDHEYTYNLAQPHGVTWPTSLHLNNHITRGSVVSLSKEDLQLMGFAADPDGTQNPDFQFYMNEGTYFDEDIRYDLATGPMWSPTYYQLAGEKVRFHVQSTAAGHPADCHFYSSYDTPGGTYGAPYINDLSAGGALALVEDGKYFIGKLFGVKGSTVETVNIMGNEQYDTLEQARIGAVVEEQNQRQDYGILREMAYLGSVIYLYDTAYTNAYKVRFVAFSTAIEGADQKYYDGRTDRKNVLIFPESEIPGFSAVDVWRSDNQSTPRSGRWTAEDGIDPGELATSTYIRMDEDARNGSDYTALIVGIESGKKVEYVSTTGTATFTLTSAFAAIGGGKYEANVDVAETVVTGTISSGQDCIFYTEGLIEGLDYDQTLDKGNTTDKDAVHTDGTDTATLSKTGLVTDDGAGSSGSYGRFAAKVTDALFRFLAMTSTQLQGFANATTAYITRSATRTGWDIDAPSSTETAAQSAARGASDPQAMPNFGALRERDNFDLTAGTNVSIGDQQSFVNTSGHVSLGRFITTSATISAGAALFTIPAGYRPFKTEYSTISDSAGMLYTVAINTTGTVNVPDTSLTVTGVYRLVNMDYYR